MSYQPFTPTFQLAFDFFVYFSQFECCLKATGFYKPPSKRSNPAKYRAEPDWEKFAKEPKLQIRFGDTTKRDLQKAIDYFAHQPPMQQVIHQGQLDWDDDIVKGQRNPETILKGVRRVRNNLFHGGKFNGQWFAPQRSEELMKQAMVILKHCRSAVPDINKAFRDVSKSP